MENILATNTSDEVKGLQLELADLRRKLELSNNKIKTARYGLVWLDAPEAFESKASTRMPVLTEVKKKQITATDNKPEHVLIEGDNYHALTCLNYTHKGKVDIIYIDPPYNTGDITSENTFKYNDKRYIKQFPDGTPVPKDHPLRHSYWLSFMYKRLELAYNILSEKGVAIIHIDENELHNLGLLLATRIFQEKNELGTIIWNKQNPKGDSQGVATMHEYVICFAKNKEEFLKQDGTLLRKKPNAVQMLTKARGLFSKLGKLELPEEIKEVIKPFDYPDEVVKDFKVKYDLKLVNKEFQNWLSKQSFSEGEKMYKYIDADGKVYRGVYMGWPNKKKAPADYFIPLKHPVTGKNCPVPERGWRNPSSTMQKLLGSNQYVVNHDNSILQGEILFGADENKQPERKYLLEQNLYENTPSIYTYGGSDDKFFSGINLEFPYAKPVDVAKYFLTSIHPNPKIVLDYFAGSGTTLHAVLEINKQENKNIQCILVTNNENDICTDITYPRIEKVITGYELKIKDKTFAVEGLGNSLKYYETDFVGDNNIIRANDEDKLVLASKAGCLLGLAENTLAEKRSNNYYQFFEGFGKTTAIYYREELDEMGAFIDLVKKSGLDTIVYLFSWGNNSEFESLFEDIPNVKVKVIPQPILEIYRKIYKII